MPSPLTAHIIALRDKTYPSAPSWTVVFDENSTAAKALVSAYREVLPMANYIAYTGENGTEISDYLHTLARESVVALIQSSNFRLSKHRIRVELAHLSIHTVEYARLNYIRDEEIPQWMDAFTPRTELYEELSDKIEAHMIGAKNLEIISVGGATLKCDEIESPRRNTGDFSKSVAKGSLFPVGEIFTEAKDLVTLNGTLMIDAYPDEHVCPIICEPFAVEVKHGLIEYTPEKWPEFFTVSYNQVLAEEGNVRLREIGIGFNPAMSRDKVVNEIGHFERKMGMHLSMGAKHGVWNKKLEDLQPQRYHIDLFVALEELRIDGKSILKRVDTKNELYEWQLGELTNGIC